MQIDIFTAPCSSNLAHCIMRNTGDFCIYSKRIDETISILNLVLIRVFQYCMDIAYIKMFL
jgi:hypothetical protein